MKRYLDLFKKYLTKDEQMKLDKKFVQELQQLIGKKLKDPEMAKKAAMIIEQMIAEKAEDQPQKKTTKRKSA